MSDWYTQIGPPGQLAVWLGASFLLYVLTAQLVWQYRYPGRPDPLGRWIDQARGRWFIWLAGEVGRFVYFLGLPFLAAQSGLLGNDLLGLTGTDWGADRNGLGFLWSDWAKGLGLVAAVGLATWMLFALAAWSARRAGLELFHFKEGEIVPTLRGYHLLGVVYDQVHWAFYRCGPLVWFDQLYYGVFAGSLIALIELGLNPAVYYQLEERRVWVRLALAWISALLFLATRNFWLSLALHLGLQIPLGHAWAGGRPAQNIRSLQEERQHDQAA